ncbi:response regulator [uncultured Sulfitobacter sp.]|uniref:response regulator n=1 Tax=uncultured Sulfitobacter sp. TaxID=191468 RepID=UPI0026190077|nr:response regulator [uncultured Sulfitobacter sp.]
MRLLAVDDDPLILDLLPVVFKQADFPQITVASSGMDALNILSDPDAQFDCLLLDIEMPGMTGVELCSRIRALPQYRDTPILMLTSVTDRGIIERAFAAGANDYINKPFDVKEITTRVRVAKRMTETVGSAPRLNPVDLPADGAKGEHPFKIGDSVRLANIDQLVLPFSLGNYLSQLSRRRLDTCSIFAVRIENMDSLFAECNTRELAVALSEVSEAVTDVVDCPKLLTAYDGDGTFLCITQQAQSLVWPEIEDRVHALLGEGAAMFEDGSPMNICVAIGNPIPPNASRNQRVKKTFDRAIGRALMREKTKVRQLS